MAGNIKFKLTGFCTLLAFTSLIFIAARCGDDKPFASQNIIFIYPIEIEPSGDVINRGDTLWITANIHKDSIREYFSGDFFTLDNVPIPCSLSLFKLVSNQLTLSEQPGATESFVFLNIIGGVSLFGETFSVLNFHNNSNENRYQLRVGIIPKEAGVFSTNILPTGNQYDLEKVLDLGKAKNGAKIIPIHDDNFFPINNGESLNFDLYVQYCKPVSPNYPDDYRGMNHEEKGTFTFRVVD